MIARLKGMFDIYILALFGTVLLASLAPARGAFAGVASGAANAGVVVLFFLHGAKLSRGAILAGAANWQLHGTVLAMTFLMFPALGLAISAIPGLPGEVATGMLFLAVLPSTVQSSIAFTSIARGNVAAAVCSASLSNVVGIFLTPLLVALLIGGLGASIGNTVGNTGAAVERIVLQLLVPFVAGHLLQPVVGGWIGRQKLLVMLVDRGSILLVVYSAFSAAVLGGLWQRTPATELALIVALACGLLVVALAASWALGRAFGFCRAERIVLLFCGSKKSLASGVPMAGVLFPAAAVGAVILPLMVFHQIQLVACAIIARRMADVDEPHP